MTSPERRPPNPEMDLPPVDTPTRIKLQLHLMYRMKGSALTDEYANDWIGRYAELVKDLIDESGDVSRSIRASLEKGDFEKAVDIVYSYIAPYEAKTEKPSSTIPDVASPPERRTPASGEPLTA